MKPDEKDFVHVQSLNFEKSSDWQCRLLDNVVYVPHEGKEPNRFHRFMQRLAFGVVWERKK